MRILRTLAVLLAGACVFAGQAAGQDIPDAPPSEWLIPADSVDALFSRENAVIVHHRTSGPYPRNLVLIAFRNEATPAERGQAVHAVRGSLVGGNGVYYVVQVDGACGDDPVWCAIDILEKLPQVEESHPFIVRGPPDTDTAVPVPPYPG